MSHLAKKFKQQGESEEEQEKEYEVEAILGRRTNKKGKFRYEVKWKHYSSKHNTWFKLFVYKKK